MCWNNTLKFYKFDRNNKQIQEGHKKYEKKNNKKYTKHILMKWLKNNNKEEILRTTKKNKSYVQRSKDKYDKRFCMIKNAGRKTEKSCSSIKNSNSIVIENIL